MVVLELIILVIAYTALVLSIFLSILCFRKNLESWQTIALSSSLLLLILAMTIPALRGPQAVVQTTPTPTLLAMILVGLTTPLSIVSERKHHLPSFWQKILYTLTLALGLATSIAHFLDKVEYIEYGVVGFLGISVASSMILVRVTQPLKKVAHLEKVNRLFSIAFLIVVPASLFANYTSHEIADLRIGLTLPLVFILLAAHKVWDDLHRLSLFRQYPKGELLGHFALSEREKQIALLLGAGKTYKEIGEDLFISLPTVKTHASNIYKKCGVKSRAELMALLMK